MAGFAFSYYESGGNLGAAAIGGLTGALSGALGGALTGSVGRIIARQLIGGAALGAADAAGKNAVDGGCRDVLQAGVKGAVGQISGLVGGRQVGRYVQGRRGILGRDADSEAVGDLAGAAFAGFINLVPDV